MIVRCCAARMLDGAMAMAAMGTRGYRANNARNKVAYLDPPSWNAPVDPLMLMPLKRWMTENARTMWVS